MGVDSFLNQPERETAEIRNRSIILYLRRIKTSFLHCRRGTTLASFCHEGKQPVVIDASHISVSTSLGSDAFQQVHCTFAI